MADLVKPSEIMGTAIKRTVAELEECPPSELGSLCQTVDPKNLNALSTEAQSESLDSDTERRYALYRKLST